MPLDDTTDDLPVLDTGPHYFAHYQDDGPAGPSGQDMRTTSPWNRLHLFSSPKAMLDFIHDTKHGGDTGRRNARITGYWSDTDHNYPLIADWRTIESTVECRKLDIDSNEVTA